MLGYRRAGDFRTRPLLDLQSVADTEPMFSRWFKAKSSPAPAHADVVVDLFRIAGDLQQRSWTQLSERERVFLAIWQLEAEVNNGGFDQYFRNSAGELAPFATEALLEIGAPNCAAIVSRAVQLVLGERRDWSAARSAFPDASPDIGEALKPVDQKFYLYPDDLEALLRAYVSGQRLGG